MKSISRYVFVLIFITSCAQETTDTIENDLLARTYFNEFMPCQTGPDYSAENMTKMIAHWQSLLTDEALMGVWGYAPASDQNLYPDTGWWELQWSSKEAADNAWSQWVENAEAAKWQAEYENVLVCDGDARNGFEGVFPIAAEEFGDLPDSGYFFSAVWLCNFNEGYGIKDAKGFLPKFANTVKASNGYNKTSYHFGNYFADDNPDADFLWADFTNSRDSMMQAAAAFEQDVAPDMFPIFSQFAACGDRPDEYDGWMLYDAENKDFAPRFMD